MKDTRQKAIFLPTGEIGRVIYQAHQNKEGRMKIDCDDIANYNGNAAFETIESDPENFVIIK
jgi:hypothetical protein